jgi:LmbE family N-acetylglucosaminyl deacetylase
MKPEEYVPKIALSVQAHPDDQDFTVAGTLAKWAQTSCRVISLIVTSGEAGSNEPTHTVTYKKELTRIREIEQTQANKILGIEDTVFLRFPDGELELRCLAHITVIRK